MSLHVAADLSGRVTGREIYRRIMMLCCQVQHVLYNAASHLRVPYWHLSAPPKAEVGPQSLLVAVGAADAVDASICVRLGFA